MTNNLDMESRILEMEGGVNNNLFLFLNFTEGEVEPQGEIKNLD